MLNCDSVKLRSRIHRIQKQRLVQLVQNFCIRRIGRDFRVNDVKIDKQSWETFAYDLNLIGPAKSPDEYKQSFNYMKSRVRSKMGLILQSNGNAEDNLSELDLKIYKMFPLVFENGRNEPEGIDVQHVQNDSNVLQCNSQRMSNGLMNDNEINEAMEEEQLHDETNLREFDSQRISNGRMNDNKTVIVIDDEQLQDETNLQNFHSQGISEGWMSDNEFDEVVTDDLLNYQTNLQQFDSQHISNGRPNENESHEVIDDEYLQDETDLQVCQLPRISVVHSAEEIEAYMNETHMISDMLAEDSSHQHESSNHRLYGDSIDRRCIESTKGESTTSISGNIANTRGGSTLSMRRKSVSIRGGSMRGKSVNTRGGSTMSMRGKSVNTRGGSTMSMRGKSVTTRGGSTMSKRGKSPNNRIGLTTSIRGEERRAENFDMVTEVIPDLQRERLVQLVHNNFLKTVGRYSGVNGVKQKRQLWDKYARELNALGPPRTALQWENCLDYIRGTARMKLAENRRNENEFGVGKKVLSRLEEKVVCTWGLNNLDGEQQLGEGGFQYDKTIVDRSKNWTASKAREEGGLLGLNRSESTQMSNSTITSGAYTATLSRPGAVTNDRDTRAVHIVSKCNLCSSPNLHSHCKECNYFLCGVCDMMYHKHTNRENHSRTTIGDRTQNSRETSIICENIINDSRDNLDPSEGNELTTSPRGGASMAESRRCNVSNTNRGESEDIQSFRSTRENIANVTGDQPEIIGRSNRITSHPTNIFESLDIQSERRPRSAPAHMRSSTANVTQFRNSQEDARRTNTSSRVGTPHLRELEAALPYRNARLNVSLAQDHPLATSRIDASRERDRSRERNRYTSYDMVQRSINAQDDFIDQSDRNHSEMIYVLTSTVNKFAEVIREYLNRN